MLGILPCPAPSPDLESPAGGRFGLASLGSSGPPELLDTEYFLPLVQGSNPGWFWASRLVWAWAQRFLVSTWWVSPPQLLGLECVVVVGAIIPPGSASRAGQT